MFQNIWENKPMLLNKEQMDYSHFINHSMKCVNILKIFDILKSLIDNWILMPKIAILKPV